MNRFTFLGMLLIILGAIGPVIQAEEYPRMSGSIFWQPYNYDAFTVSLYHFDEKQAAPKAEVNVDQLLLEDSDKDENLLEKVDKETPVVNQNLRKSANANTAGMEAVLKGRAKLVAAGRFGGGVRLEGGDSAIICPGSAGRKYRTVEFWLKPVKYPASKAAIVSLAAPRRRNELSPEDKAFNAALGEAVLYLRNDGSLQLDWFKTEHAWRKIKLPLNQWTHLALSVSIGWPTANTVRLFLNGQERQVLEVPKSHAELLTAKADVIAIGNRWPIQPSLGVNAWIDEVRISNKYRNFYSYQLDWPGQRTVTDTREGQPYFRDPNDLIFHLDFNKTLKPRRCAPKTVWPKKAEITASDEDLNPSKVAKTYPPGVEGTGFYLGDGCIWPVFKGKGNIDNKNGTLAFWLQPLDWDNLLRDNRFDNISPTLFSLFHIEGENVPGSQARTWGKRSHLLDLIFDLQLPESLKDPAQLTPGRWYHIAYTWQDDKIYTYCNGRFLREEYPPEMGVLPGCSGSIAPWNTWMSLAQASKGKDWWHPHNRKMSNWTNAQADTIAFTRHRYWNPKVPHPKSVIDDFRVYNRALAPSEIANLAQLHQPRQPMTKLPDVDMTIKYNGVSGLVEVNLTPLMKDYLQAATVEITVAEKDTNKSIGSKTVKLADDYQVRTTLETPPMKFTTYQVKTIVRDQGGKALGVATREFTRTTPPWWNCQAGISDKVIPGWKPMQVKDNIVKISMRDISFAPSGLPEKIISAGRNILSSPIELQISDQGKPIPLKSGTPKVKIVKQSAIRVDTRGTLTGPNLLITTDAYTEFDGMMYYTVTLEPTGQPGPVFDCLTITLPFQQQNAELVHWWSGDRGFRNPKIVHIGALPEKPGVLFRSNDSAVLQKCPKMRGSFIPYVMLTGMKRGMAWFGENDQGWTKSDEIPAVTIERRDNSVVLKLTIICRKTVLNSKLTFGFGLQPIPVRRLDPRFRAAPASYTNLIVDGFSGNNLKGPQDDDSSAFNVYPVDSWENVRQRMNSDGRNREGGVAGLKTLNDRHLAQFRQRVGRDPLPIETCPPGLYQDMQNIGHVPVHSREWAETWRPAGDFLHYTKELVDYTSWAWNDWITNTGKFIRGMYMDDCWGAPQQTWPGPVAYKLADGHVQPGFQFRGWRERMKRIRQIFHDQGIYPRFTAHTTHTFMIPYHAFFDFITDGEDFYSSPTKADGQSDFIDHWPLDRMRFMNAEKWGLVTTWLGWCGGGTPVQRWPAWKFRQERAYVANLALHDIMHKFDGKTFEDFGMRDPDVEFIPYWNDRGLAEYQNSTLKISAWKHQGKCLMILVNVGDQRLEAKVKLNPEVMGMGRIPASDIEITQCDPTLLTYFKEDATTVEKPVEAKIDRVLLADKDEPGDTEEMTLEEDLSTLPLEKRRDMDPDGKFEWENGILSCPVRRHDYRLFLFEPAGKK